jgi:small ligand-binding sensory domain FIST
VAPFHAYVESNGDESRVSGLPSLRGARAAVLLADPYTFPTDAILAALATEAPGIPVLGGLASARGIGGSAALISGRHVVDEGAVGVLFRELELIPCVSQGAAPIRPEVTITAAEGHVIHELAGRPALEMVEQLIAQLGTA